MFHAFIIVCHLTINIQLVDFSLMFINPIFYVAVYRIYTSIIFHGSILHVMFNMLAFVPLGSELERITGSIRMLYMIILLATSNAILHLLIALLAACIPFNQSDYLMNECAIGFSGVIFSMIVIETSLSGVQSRRLVFSSAEYKIFYMLPSLNLCIQTSKASVYVYTCFVSPLPRG